MLIVQCDFDDTVTVGNVSTAVREAFASDEWVEMEREYHAGAHSVEESNIRQYRLIRAKQEEIEGFVVEHVAVRHAFEEFADYCRRAGIRLVIVSSGLDLYINPTLHRLGLDQLEVRSAKGRVTPDGVSVAYTDPAGSPLTRGFKDSYVRHFKDKGNTVIYVGDGLSDFGPAQIADFVIARSHLEEHCRASGLAHYRFDTFVDVGRHVEAIRRKVGG